MSLLLATSAFVFGSIAGSFINALSFRFGTGVSILTGRSRCMRCAHTLGALDLVPVLSWGLLRGRCRYCSTKISIQYPLVELIAATLSLALYLQFPDPLYYAYWFVVWMILLFVAVYDMRHQIIPWSCSGLLVLLALAGLYAGIIPMTWGSLAAGPVLALPLLLFYAVSRGRWMGLGDGVLQLSLGWFLGLTLGLTAFMFAFWIGASVGIVGVLMHRGVTMKSEVPFAPFLIVGALVAFITHVDLFQSLPYYFQ